MPSMSPYLWVGSLALLLLVLGVLLLGGRRPPAGNSGHARPSLLRRTFGLLLFLCGLLGILLAFSVYQYLQLFVDRPVAMVALSQQAPQRFQATVTLNDKDIVGTSSEPQQFELAGDAWMMDARVLRWRLPATLAGLSSLYRLERLSGRYDDLTQERQAERTVHEIRTQQWPDLWSLKRSHGQWLPFVDAQFGSATWMPMFDGASYLVLINDRGGLVARPADTATAEGLKARGW